MNDSKNNIESQIKTMLNEVMEDEELKEEKDENIGFSDEEETDNNSSNNPLNQMFTNNKDFNTGSFNKNKILNKNDFLVYENTNFIRKYPKKSLTVNNQNSMTQNFFEQINRNYFQTQIIHKPFIFNNNFIPNNSNFMITNYMNNPIDNTNNNIQLINNSNFLRNENRKKTFEKKTKKFINDNNNKKFGSVTFPKEVNVKIEIILFEIKKILSKANKIDYLIYSKLQGNFINVIKSHKGSRIFQNYLKNTHSDILHQILNEILPCLNELIIDPYANYFCKKLFTYLNQKDRNEYLNAIKNNLIELSCNSIGTYPIQGIIELIESKSEKTLIINSIKFYIYKLAFDPFGCHVIEKIICYFEEDLISFIYDFIINNFLDLSYNQNGICIIKKFVSFIHKVKYHEKIKKIIEENSISLIKHVYGNYVFQVLINHWEEKEIIQIFSLFQNNLTSLSNEKYASNVIERWIEKSDKVLNIYVTEIIQSKKISLIMKNNFGNYVIQKALKISNNNLEKILVNEVNNNIYKLNDKKLIEKWKNIILSHINTLNQTFV